MDIWSLIYLGILLFVFWIAARWFYRHTGLASIYAREHYVSLYDLYKLQEALKKRKLTFKDLDDFYKEVIIGKGNDLDRIDAHYDNQDKDISTGK